MPFQTKTQATTDSLLLYRLFRFHDPLCKHIEPLVKPMLPSLNATALQQGLDGLSQANFFLALSGV